MPPTQPVIRRRTLNKTETACASKPDLQVRGKIFDIKRYAVHDGPGIRTTVFFKGCPLDCRWCHNPEAKSADFQLSYKESRCIRCGDCTAVCPQQALTLNGRLLVDRDRCRVSGDCAAVCPTEALEIIGRDVSAAEVMKVVKQDRIFFEESNGGVTFSGGEPLMQPPFLEVLLRACRNQDIHICLDTCGQAPWSVLDGVRPWVDLFLYDLKSVDPELHRRETGQSNELILENLRKLAETGQPIVIRIPLIPGINDTPGELRNMGEFILGLQGVKDISLLPFHDIAKEKYGRLDKPSSIDGLKPQPAEEIINSKLRLEEFGLNVTIGS
jgi:pyruvate formate lyase activating enzyme